MLDLLIVGGGPAGLSAGIYAMRAGLKTLLIEQAFPGGQIAEAKDLANYPGFPNGISGAEFSALVKKQAENLGLDILTDNIIKLDITNKEKTASSKDHTYTAKNIILAMGISKKIGIPGEKEFTGMGVSYCATCDGGFFKKKRVMVIGGGNAAGEDAMYLSNICEKVYLVHKHNELQMKKQLQDKILSAENIECLMNCEVVNIFGKDFVAGADIEYSNGSQQTVWGISGIFIAAGKSPNTHMVPGELLDGKGYIIAGEDTKTKIDGVFAVGDIRSKPLRQVVTACADGANAVHQILNL